MAVKESSDSASSSLKTATPRSLKDLFALAFATWGVGYLPVAPGTWGSLVGVGIFLGWQILRVRFFDLYGVNSASANSLWTTLSILLVIVISLIGIWSGTRVEKLTGRKDAGIVVVDEVAGQLITLFVLPYALAWDWPLILAGFLLFRLFDIWKPFPVRRFESLEGGLGVMADDIAAGFYAAASLSVVVAIRSFI
jgi:phosphatidylglycerophosphatase A